MNRVSRSPRVPKARYKDYNGPGVRVYLFFCTWLSVSFFGLQETVTLLEGYGAQSAQKLNTHIYIHTVSRVS